MPARVSASRSSGAAGQSLKPLAGLLAAIPAMVLIAAAIPRFIAGLTLEASLPVPISMIRQDPLPAATFRSAAQTLRRDGAGDGSLVLVASEAALKGGQPPAQLVPLVDGALAREPASARGWMVLSDVTQPGDAVRSGQALSRSFALAPYDYWLAGWRAVRAGQLWDSLDETARTRALHQVRLIWEQRQLRRHLRTVLSSGDGVILVARAFATDVDELRRLNRWVAAERRWRNRKPQ